MNWLLLRGLVREQRHWGDFPILLETGIKKTDPNAKVFCLDHPGFGTEADRPSPQTVTEMVEDLRERWLRLQAAQGIDSSDWGLFSVSLGGMVALEWCSTHPYDFKKLVLTNSSISGLSPLYKRMKPFNYPTILSLLLSANIAKREEKILKMTSNLRGDALLERAQRHAAFALPVRKSDAIAQLYAGATFKAPEKMLTPLLVLNSEGDRLVDPSCSEVIAKRYGAKLFTHPSANHDLSIDDPQWIVDRVNSWAEK